jgi:tRNA pseudouridine55 synthase
MHELARAGIEVERRARPVAIEQLDLLSWEAPLVMIDVRCGKGTYIRSLARDIGAALGCGAHLASLRRTAVGTFSIEDAAPLDALGPALLLPPETAVADWPAVTLDEAAAGRVRNGLPIRLAQLAGQRARAHGPDGALLALLARDGDIFRPEKVFDWTRP